MTLREEIIYNKLIKYSMVDEKNDTIYINNEFKSIVTKAQIELGTLDYFKVNLFYRPLEDKGGLLEKGKCFIKRIIRKLNVFYVKPICDQQTAFNCAVFNSSQELITGAKVINSELMTLMNEVSTLKKELRSCKQELAQLKKNLPVSNDTTESKGE